MPSLHRPSAGSTLGQCQEDDTVRILCTRPGQTNDDLTGRRGQSRGGGRGLVAQVRRPPPAVFVLCHGQNLL